MSMTMIFTVIAIVIRTVINKQNEFIGYISFDDDMTIFFAKL